MKFVKRSMLLLCVIGCVLYIIRMSAQSNISSPVTSRKPTSTPILNNTSNPSIVFDDHTYAYNYFSVPSIGTIRLIPNFSEKKTSSELVQRYSCQSAINGGFYDTNSLPLGGFMTNKIVTKKPVHNRLIDGYLWGNTKRAFITLSEPQDDAVFYLQTGPLLMVKGGMTSISIANDEYKRRSVAALTDDGTLLFLTMYNPESVYEGPLLSDLPTIIQELSKKGEFQIYDAVNLDGGSASAYISKDRTLQEFSAIGSMFCVQ